MESDRDRRQGAGDPAEPDPRGRRDRQGEAGRHGPDPKRRDPAGSATEPRPGDSRESDEDRGERGREYDIARRQMPIQR